MARFDYDEIREVAEELIEEFGQDAELLVPTNTGTEYAPREGMVSHPIVLVDLEQMATVAGSGTLVQSVTRSVLISTRSAVAPASNHSIKIRGRTHPIEELAELSPGGTVLMWEAKLGAAEEEE